MFKKSEMGLYPAGNPLSVSRKRTVLNPTLFRKSPLAARTAAALACAAGILGPLRPALADVPAKIDISKFPATVVDHVVVPVPSEVFNVLDKLEKPDWPALVRVDGSKVPAERAGIALLLGSVIADGFIAVEANNSQAVKDIGRRVLKLAEAIGVRESVVARSNAIIEAADKKKWSLVRIELDRALFDVRQAMIELRDEQLAQLVSLGGWLRGTEVLTRIVKASYTAAGAELLHQPDLLRFFQNKLESMSPRLQENAAVKNIRAQLPKIGPLIEMRNNDDISAQQVAQVGTIVDDLMKSIVPPQPPK